MANEISEKTKITIDLKTIGLVIGGLVMMIGMWFTSPTPQFKSINSSALSFLHSPTPTSVHDHRKNHSLN